MIVGEHSLESAIEWMENSISGMGVISSRSTVTVCGAIMADDAIYRTFLKPGEIDAWRKT